VHPRRSERDAPEHRAVEGWRRLLNQTIPGTNNARVRFITQPVYMWTPPITWHFEPHRALAALARDGDRAAPPRSDRDRNVRRLHLGLPTSMVLVSANIRNEVGYFNFATPLNTLSRSQQLLAVGQLVLTAYRVGAARGIIIKVGDVTQRLLMPDGAKATLVSQKDFESLLN